MRIKNAWKAFVVHICMYIFRIETKYNQGFFSVTHPSDDENKQTSADITCFSADAGYLRRDATFALSPVESMRDICSIDFLNLNDTCQI